MSEFNIDIFFITKMADIAWLTGFDGSTAYLAIGRDKALFITDGRYETYAKEILSAEWDLEIVKSYSEYFESFAKSHKRITMQPCGNVSLYITFRKAGAEVGVDMDDLLQHMRMIKTPAEIAAIRDEYRLAAAAFTSSLGEWRFGQTEKAWAALLEFKMKELGADGPSFETIIASGTRGALPHGVASDKLIETAEAVTIDFGSARMYKSDYTRVIYNGKNKEILKVINTVHDAMRLAIDAVKPGIACSELDSIARKHIASAGYGQYFNHSLGHGVGIEVHEKPVLNAKSEDIVAPGMVFTIEPGIYIPGKFGIRLEDTVVVNETGCELLSSVLDKYVYTL